MTKFIEVHLTGSSILINLAHVEEIICNTKGGMRHLFCISNSESNIQRLYYTR